MHADLAKLVADIATRHAELDEKVKILLDSQVKTEELFRQTERRINRRIEKLVSAIGEFISHMPPPPK